MSWDKSGNPIQGIADHVSLFSRLFGDGAMSIEQRRHLLNRKRSVLDAVRSDVASVGRTVSVNDRRKVNEFYDLIRDIETRLARDEDWLARPKPGAPLDQPPAAPLGTAGAQTRRLSCRFLRGQHRSPTRDLCVILEET